jgi:hypothetical protein
MKKNFKLVAVLLSMSLMLSSCIGSFNLTNKVKDWNEGLGNKFVNELVFIGMHIIPVYPLTLLADGVVLNTIEFWTGSSAISKKENGTKIVKNQKGENVAVTSCADGYVISNGAEELKLQFNEADNSWSVEYNNTVNKLISIDGDNAQLYMLNGETMNVTLDEAGVAMARQMVMGDYAQK